MAESNGCAKALRRVTRGGAESTSSPGARAFEHARLVATMESYFTRNGWQAKGTFNATRDGGRCTGHSAAELQEACSNIIFSLLPILAAASAYFLVKRSTRPAVSISFCLPVKKGWQLEQISTFSMSPLTVERVGKLFPQAQWTVTAMIVGVNTGLHESPILSRPVCAPSRVSRNSTGASLGRKSTSHCNAAWANPANLEKSGGVSVCQRHDFF